MLEVSQTFLGNKTARKFLFFYMLVMHVLVFVTLYRSLRPRRLHAHAGPCARARARELPRELPRNYPLYPCLATRVAARKAHTRKTHTRAPRRLPQVHAQHGL